MSHWPPPSPATILVHPDLKPAYRPVVAAVTAGIRAGGIGEPALCSLEQFGSQGRSFTPTTIFALGDQVASALAAGSDRARIIALLVQALPPAVDSGIALFLDPAAVLDDILALRPGIRSLHFVHLARIPTTILHQVRTLTHRRGIDFNPVPVSSLRAAA